MSNDCYKKYTHKLSLDKLRIDTQSCKTKPLSRSIRSQGRHKVQTGSCIICTNVTSKKVRQLQELQGEDRAKTLFEASRFFQDHVFTETSLCATYMDLFNMRIKYHKNCMSNYENKYLR